jgi:dienelactone hydrolase
MIGDMTSFLGNRRRYSPARLGGWWVAVLLGLGTGGCAGLDSMSAATARAQAAAMAGAAGMRSDRVDANGLPIQVFHRGLRDAATVVVYVEGDGQAWRTPHRAATDPTPRQPIGLELATRDPSPAVLYVARPCQFVGAGTAPCEPRWWTSHRYAAAVVEAMQAAIEQALRTAGRDPRRTPTAFVGYSGGGTIAVLLAARTGNVEWLGTVAGNLDHAAWTRLHRVSPLDGSLNAVDVAAQLRAIPQVHLIGERDRNVPQSLLSAYVERSGAASMRVAIVASADHDCCWAEQWPMLLCRELSALSVTATSCPASPAAANATAQPR